MKTITQMATLVALPLMSIFSMYAEDVTPETFGVAEQMSFETTISTAGGADGWYVQTSAYLYRSEDRAYDGVASMMATIAAGETPTTLQMQTDDVGGGENAPVHEAGKNYVITCWVYIDGTKNSMLQTLQIISFKNWYITEIDLTGIERDTWVQVQTDSFCYEEETSTKMTVKILSNTTDNADGILMYLDKFELYDADKLGTSGGTTDDGDENEDDDSALVASTEADEILSVTGKNDIISIAGAEAGAAVEVYAISGCKVASTVAKAGTLTIPATTGIYIVKVGTEVVKVAL